MRGEKFEGQQCNCGSTIRYRATLSCVSCDIDSNRFRLKNIRDAKTSYSDIEAACEAGKVSDCNENPYSYDSEIGKFCAWQAGYNDNN